MRQLAHGVALLTWTLVSAAPESCHGGGCKAPDDDIQSLLQTDLHTQRGREALSSALGSQDAAGGGSRAWWSDAKSGLVTVPEVSETTPYEYNATRVDMNRLFRLKLNAALEYMMTQCPNGVSEMDEKDCYRSAAEVEILLTIAKNPNITAESPEIQVAFPIKYWLWSPGPPSSMWIPDKDDNGVLSYKEYLALAPKKELTPFANTTIRIIDEDEDGRITQGEVYKWNRVLILVRSQVPELDTSNSDASTGACLGKAVIFLRMHERPKTWAIQPIKIIYVVLIFFGAFLLWNYYSLWLCLTSNGRK